MVTVTQKGSWKETEKFLKKKMGRNYRSILEKYAKQGVAALSAATPMDTGTTAYAWDYEIIQNQGGLEIQWFNYNVVNGVNIALILQTGHGTRGGGYVKGRDYINPALQPIFDKMADEIWKEVSS